MTRRLVALVLVILGLTAIRSAAEPVVPIRLNGSADNRLNLVILGDGYAQADMLKFATDVDLMVIGLFRQTPFVEYANYFNVYRVDVVSNESGVDHPENNVTRDTALGAYYNCSSIQRLICVNTSLVNAVLTRSVPGNARDLVVVLVNDAEYGGSGGSVAVASTHTSVVDLILHETGHTLGLLADEYTSQPPACESATEPSQANASRESTIAVKWSHWIAAGTTLPSTGTTEGVVGTYLGARYCPEGLFRPTYNSKMRSLTNAFESVNNEQLIKRFYNFVDPVDGVTPATGTLTPAAGAALDFSATPLRPSSHSLTVRWRLNGQVVGQASTYRLSTTGMTAGSYTVEVEVSDPTSLVRRDPAGALVETRRWTIVIPQTTTPTDLDAALERWRTR